MENFYNYYKNFKLYLYSFFWTADVFTPYEIELIQKNEGLKQKLDLLDLNEIYKTLGLISKNFNRLTPPEEILLFLNRELNITKLTFEIKPETINAKNIVSNTLLKYLKEKFEIIVYIKNKVDYKI